MNETDDTKTPCAAYSISQSTGAASCAMHGYLPLICPCGDYSPDLDAYGYRASRWEALMRQRQQDMLIGA
jgi:hypothetical protein